MTFVLMVRREGGAAEIDFLCCFSASSEMTFVLKGVKERRGLEGGGQGDGEEVVGVLPGLCYGEAGGG
jgi:hypothetical protein